MKDKYEELIEMDLTINLKNDSEYLARMKKRFVEDTKQNKKLNIEEQKKLAFKNLYDAGLITESGNLKKKYK